MLSRRVIAYYGLIRVSESLSATYAFAAGSAAPKEIGLRWESRGSPIYSVGLGSRAASHTPVAPKSANDCCFLFGFSLHLLVLQRHVLQLSMVQVIVFQELKSFLRISIRTWLMDQNPCETSHFLAIGVLTQRCTGNCIYAASPLRRAMIRTPLITSFALTHSQTRFRCRTHDGSGDNPPPNDVRAPKVRSIAPRQANTPRPKADHISSMHRSRYGLW